MAMDSSKEAITERLRASQARRPRPRLGHEPVSPYWAAQLDRMDQLLGGGGLQAPPPQRHNRRPSAASVRSSQSDLDFWVSSGPSSELDQLKDTLRIQEEVISRQHHELEQARAHIAQLESRRTRDHPELVPQVNAALGFLVGLTENRISDPAEVDRAWGEHAELSFQMPCLLALKLSVESLCRACHEERGDLEGKITTLLDIIEANPSMGTGQQQLVQACQRAEQLQAELDDLGKGYPQQAPVPALPFMGTLLKKGEHINTWNERWLVVHERTLQVFQDRSSREAKRVLHFAQMANVTRSAKQPNSFKIEMKPTGDGAQGKRLYFQADSNKKLLEWLYTLQYLTAAAHGEWLQSTVPSPRRPTVAPQPHSQVQVQNPGQQQLAREAVEVPPSTVQELDATMIANGPKSRAPAPGGRQSSFAKME